MASSTLTWKILICVLSLAVGIHSMAFYPRLGGKRAAFYPRLAGKRAIFYPRLGRSGPQSSLKECCPVGLSKEWRKSADGQTETTFNCDEGQSCCEGLTEILEQKKNGEFYLMCAPPRC